MIISKRLLLLIVAFLFIFSALATSVSIKQMAAEERCIKCHLDIFDTYQEDDGNVIDVAHISNAMVCADCHFGNNFIGTLSLNKHAIDAWRFESSGTDLNASVDKTKMTNTCLDCHFDYRNIGGNDSSVDPHSVGKNCSSCHVSHNTGMGIQVCSKCHAKQYDEITTDGGRHQISCDVCHVSHGFVPECKICHGLRHGETKTDCTTCHVNPHIPTVLNFTEADTIGHCKECHFEVNAIFNEYPNRHKNIDCSICHTKHGKIPECTLCHATPHKLVSQDCMDCHQSGHDPWWASGVVYYEQKTNDVYKLQ